MLRLARADRAVAVAAAAHHAEAHRGVVRLRRMDDGKPCADDLSVPSSSDFQTSQEPPMSWPPPGPDRSPKVAGPDRMARLLYRPQEVLTLSEKSRPRRDQRA